MKTRFLILLVVLAVLIISYPVTISNIYRLVSGEPAAPSEISTADSAESNENEAEEPAPEPLDPSEITAVRDEHANFTATWARTPRYFFLVSGPYLYRVPFGNVARGETVTVPGTGDVEIVGVTTENLYVSRSGQNWATFRIALADLQAELIDEGEYFGVPRFHPASNSILFAYGDSDERSVRLEALRLDTGTRRTVYEFESRNFDSGMGWWQMENDALVFINSSWGGAEPYSDFIYINHELRTARLQLDDIYWSAGNPPQPQNPAEEFIFDNNVGVWHGTYATVGGWVYYLRWESWESAIDLYRIRLDGTDNTLIHENTDIFTLLGINDTLFATVFTDTEFEDAVEWHEAVKLSPDGYPEQVLGRGWHGHNQSFGISRLPGTDMLMINQSDFFRVDSLVVGVYCLAGGGLFGVNDPTPS